MDLLFRIILMIFIFTIFLNSKIETKNCINYYIDENFDPRPKKGNGGNTKIDIGGKFRSKDLKLFLGEKQFYDSKFQTDSRIPDEIDDLFFSKYDNCLKVFKSNKLVLEYELITGYKYVYIYESFYECKFIFKYANYKNINY